MHGVRVHSFEVWSRDGTLVAGEIGCAVGGVYTSLSGFKTVDSSGSVQLSCVVPVLRKCGFSLWDLGMGMGYKYDYGAKDINRLQFVARVRKLRNEPNVELTLDYTSAKVLVDEAWKCCKKNAT